MPDGRSHLEFLQQIIPPEAIARGGVPVKPSLALCNLWTMLQEDSSLPRNGTLYTLGSYIIHQLTGNNICHLTNAAPTGMVDVVERIWNHPLLSRLGLDGIKLPSLTEQDFQPCGTMSCGERALPIYPDWGDQQISVLGCMAEDDDAVINIATGAQVVVPTDRFEPGPYETRPYFEKGFYRTISNMPAGRGLAVLVRLLCQAAGKAVGAEMPETRMWNAILDGFVFDPKGIAVDTCIFPVPGKLEGGGIRGIGPENLTLSSLFSAAYADMAETYWRNIQIIKPAEHISRLICAGGVSWTPPHLVAAIEHVSGKPCRLSPIADEAMSGLFRAALVCSGVCRNLRDKPELRLKAP